MGTWKMNTIVYSKEVFENICARLRRIYGDAAVDLTKRFQHIIGRYGVGEDVPPHRAYWDENDVILITYADSVREEGMPPLAALRRFCVEHLKERISTVHILPFYPWTSDDGFSVVDYRAVAPEYGKWKHVEALGNDFSLMFDLVLNHCSRESRWFKDFVTGIAPGCQYFLPTNPELDLSRVVRPRPWPLLTRTATRDGDVWVWTTFSEDQIDINWRNPDVLFEFIDIIFHYLAKGCRVFRMDAVAFLWKEVGTDCLHRPETHEVVKLLREVVNLVCPDAVILTETNVPHEENMSYFGDGDEAHMVYNFSLPPLLLHGLLNEDSTVMTLWAAGLPDLAYGQTFLNFTASHDGIGVRPLQGLVSTDEIDLLANAVRKKGGRVSTKRNSDGSASPYELNITWWSAMADKGEDEVSEERFLCSQAVMLAFRGIPAIYFHSLVATPNDLSGMQASGENRTINRRKYDRKELDGLLLSEGETPARVFGRYLEWLKRRRNHPAFHPDAPMRVLETAANVFAFWRGSEEVGEEVLCIFNFSREAVAVQLGAWDSRFRKGKSPRDILGGKTVKLESKGTVRLDGFGAMWIRV